VAHRGPKGPRNRGQVLLEAKLPLRGQSPSKRLMSVRARRPHISCVFVIVSIPCLEGEGGGEGGRKGREGGRGRWEDGGGGGPICMDSTEAHVNPRSPTAPTEHHGADGIHGILTGYCLFFLKESQNFQNLTVGGWGGGGESGRIERGEGQIYMDFTDAHAIPRKPTEPTESTEFSRKFHGISTVFLRNFRNLTGSTESTEFRRELSEI
jgi:hypothetical protein